MINKDKSYHKRLVLLQEQNLPEGWKWVKDSVSGNYLRLPPHPLEDIK